MARRYNVAEYERAYRAANPEKLKARRAVRYAVSKGRLVRPTSCERCGATGGPIDASHDDYSRPLDVEWLCRTCHRWKDFENPTRCRRGHELTNENTYRWPGSPMVRRCRTCQADRRKRYRERRKAGILPSPTKPPVTHCMRGHEFTEANTYVPPGRPGERQCRECHRLYAKADRARKREANS